WVPSFLAVGDFNADKIRDLVVVFGGGVRVLLGTGDGSFQTTHISYVAGALPSSVAVEDFNGDGWPDLAVANAGSNDVSLLLNDGVWNGGAPGGGLAPGPGSRPPAPDLFAGQSLARVADSAVHRLAVPEAVPAAGPRQALARVPSDPQVAPVRTAGTS